MNLRSSMLPMPLYLSLMLLVLTKSLYSQGITATPRGLGLEKNEGAGQLAKGATRSYAYDVGRSSDGRFQFHEGELDDKVVRSLRWLSFRHDAYAYDPTRGMGRTWQNSVLRLGRQSWANLGSVFATNLGTATQVYSGAVLWPTMAGKPATTPAALHPALRFPFSSPFVHDGSADALIVDLTLNNGSLHNGLPWLSTHRYQLDGLEIRTNLQTPGERYPKVDNGCHDQGVITNFGAEIFAIHRISSFLSLSNPGDVWVSYLSQFTAIGKSEVHAIGVGGIPGGVDIGAGCNKLYVDLAQPHILLPWVGGTKRYRMLRAPRTPATLSTTLWIQAAWSDSVTRRFSLTRAARCAAPANLGVTDVAPRKQVLYAHGSAWNISRGWLSTRSNYLTLPIMFYGH